MLRTALSLLFVTVTCFAQVPKSPTWPDQFTAKFVTKVERYGPDWSANGVIYYDWTAKTFRADYINWCLPPFNSDNNNFTCTWLATEGSMYFINHTASQWEDHQCCMFEKGLATVPPDWMTKGKYNGTTTIRGIECDVWWFAGTNNPSDPCYGYWDSIEPDTLAQPVQFSGISPIGPTMLQYMTYEPGSIPKDIEIKLPNSSRCSRNSEQRTPLTPASDHAGSSSRRLKYIHFPDCEK